MNFKEQATALENYILEQRHWLHAHPELGTKEFKTTEHIAAELAAMGIEVQTFDDITGCIGTIKGAYPGKTVMLRADIDALPPISTHCRYRRKTIAASARRMTA